MSISQGVSPFNLAATPMFLPKFTEAPYAPKTINVVFQLLMSSTLKALFIIAITPEEKKDFNGLTKVNYLDTQDCLVIFYVPEKKQMLFLLLMTIDTDLQHVHARLLCDLQAGSLADHSSEIYIGLSHFRLLCPHQHQS